MNDYPEEYHQALKMLIPLWRGISGDYKQKYVRNIWDQFENQIRAAAYTSSVSKFISSLCSRLQIQISSDDVSDTLSALNASDERKLLRQLRDEAPTLVLIVRLENDKRKAAWEKKQELAGTMFDSNDNPFQEK